MIVECSLERKTPRGRTTRGVESPGDGDDVRLFATRTAMVKFLKVRPRA